VITLTEKQVQQAVQGVVDDAHREFNNGFFSTDTCREELIEWLDECNSAVWSNLVKDRKLADYTVDDMIETTSACGAILKVAEKDAWLEDDEGLWRGQTYGMMASIAYFSLCNLLYMSMKKAGADFNEDFPFAKWKKTK
jgi:hypothetical protein